MQEKHSIQIDPSTGRPILVALGRRDRPILTKAENADKECPFCPGKERRTPDEIDALRSEGTAAGEPGWSVRCFENLYPAARWHEVIVEGDVHSTHPGELEAAVWVDALQVYRRRLAAMESDPEVRMAYLFKNVGRHGGASIAHNHSQMLGLPILPPRLEMELEHQQGGYSPQQEIVDAEDEGRLIHAGRQHVVLCPRHPKLPFETWLVPIDEKSEFMAEDFDQDLAETMAAMYGSVDRAFGAPALNSYLHRVPGTDFRWHMELQPRVGFLAGLELGGDMYINAVSAAQAAAVLRGEEPS
ncbi:MAG: galactose-1-phosphate uridylyltransferase [Planctomycetota bacterium]|jgi:UDPglucose--hexose-1-phosphate uridylyltransferase